MAVHLELKVLEDFPAAVTLTEAAEDLDLIGDGLVSAARVGVELEVIKSEKIYFCRGTARCRVQLECSRCLEQYELKLNGEVDFSIREKHPKEQIDPAEVPDNEIVIEMVQTEVDIVGPVREALIVAMPFRPLCRETCQGLCPVCGINKNNATCSCRTEATDPRWEKLRDLLK
jgi:uncharacterized protein